MKKRQRFHGTLFFKTGSDPPPNIVTKWMCLKLENLTLRKKSNTRRVDLKALGPGEDSSSNTNAFVLPIF